MATTMEQPLLVRDAPTDLEDLGDDPDKFEFDCARGVLSIALLLGDGSLHYWRDVHRPMEYQPPENLRRVAKMFVTERPTRIDLEEAIRRHGACGYTFWLWPTPGRRF
jgi:hypothetical protein